MTKKRCGIPDRKLDNEGGRVKRFAVYGEKWKHTNLTWRLVTTFYNIILNEQVLNRHTTMYLLIYLCIVTLPTNTTQRHLASYIELQLSNCTLKITKGPPSSFSQNYYIPWYYSSFRSTTTQT